MFASDSSRANVYDAKMLSLELMEEDPKLGPTLLGSADINLAAFADKTKEPSPVDVNLLKDGTRIGVLVVQVEAANADATRRQFSVEETGYDTDGTWDLDQSDATAPSLSGFDDAMSTSRNGTSLPPFGGDPLTPRGMAARNRGGQTRTNGGPGELLERDGRHERQSSRSPGSLSASFSPRASVVSPQATGGMIGESKSVPMLRVYFDDGARPHIQTLA